MRTGERNRQRTGVTVSKDKDALKERVRTMKRSLDAPRFIGSEEDLIPFSWRHPLVLLETDRKMTKVYKNMVSLEKSLTPRGEGK